MRILRDGSGDLTCAFIDEDGPRLAILAGERGLVGAVLEGVANRLLVRSVTAQTTLRHFRSEADAGVRLTSSSVVRWDLNVSNGLELSLDLVSRLVRVGCLDLRGDDAPRRDSVVGLRRDLARVINSDGPTVWHGGGINLVLRWMNRLVTLHDGFEANLGGDFLVQLALRQARTYQVSDLGVVRINNDKQLKFVGGTVRILDRNLRTGKRARLRFLRGGDGDVVVIVHLNGPALVHVLLVEGDLSFETAVALLLRQILNQIRNLGEGDLLRFGSQRAGGAIDARNNRSVCLVVLRVVVLRVIQGERLRVDDVRLTVALQRVGAVEGLAFFADVVFSGSLELVNGTWLRQNGEVDVLVGRQIGTTVFRPGEVDVASLFVDTQELLTTGDRWVSGADELAVAVVSFHDHAGHRVVRTAVLHSRNVDRADLGFLTRDDHVLLERLPRHRNRVTFDVLARPRVYSSAECRAGTLRGIEIATMVLRVVTLPGVAHGIVGSGRSELLDLLLGQLCEDIQVSLYAKTINDDAFVGLVSDALVKEGLAGLHGRHLAGIQECAKVPRIGEVPIGKCAVLRVIKGDAQTPQGFRGAGRTRLQGVPAETSLAAARRTLLNNTRPRRQVGGLLCILLHRAGLVSDTTGEICRGRCFARQQARHDKSANS